MTNGNGPIREECRAKAQKVGPSRESLLSLRGLCFRLRGFLGPKPYTLLQTEAHDFGFRVVAQESQQV